MSTENINAPINVDNSLSRKIKRIPNVKLDVEFKENFLKEDKATFTHRNVESLFIVYKLDTWSQDLNTDVTLNDSLLDAVKLTKKADPDKYSYSDMELDLTLVHFIHFQILIGGKMNEVDNSFSVHTDNKEKDILILSRGSTQGLDDNSRS